MENGSVWPAWLHQRRLNFGRWEESYLPQARKLVTFYSEKKEFVSVFSSLLRKLRIGCWITRIVDWSKEWTCASLVDTRYDIFEQILHE